MTLNKIIDRLANLKEQGYGDNETVIYENLFNEKPYHTTIEDIKIQKATYDQEQEVIVLVP